MKPGEKDKLLMMLIVCLSLFFAACEKNSASASNKTLLSVTHASPGVRSFDALLSGNKLTQTGQVSYGTTSGMSGDPYLVGIAGTHNFRISPDDTLYYIDGNISLLLNNHYSVFMYDTLISGKLKSLVLEDELGVLPDTISAIRFINLVKDTSALEVVMTNAIDTVGIGTVSYIGDSPNPASLSPFIQIHSGSYALYVGVDSTLVFNDSVSFSGGKSYSIYSEGFLHATGATAMDVKQIQHN